MCAVVCLSADCLQHSKCHSGAPPCKILARMIWTRHLFVLGNFYPKCTKVYIHVWNNIFSKFMKMNYHNFKTKLNFIYRAAKWLLDLLKSNLNHFEFQAEVDTCQVWFNFIPDIDIALILFNWEENFNFNEFKMENRKEDRKSFFLPWNISSPYRMDHGWMVKYPMDKFTLNVHVILN